MTDHAYTRRELIRQLAAAGVAIAAMPELGRVLMFQREARIHAQGARQPPALNQEQAATLAAMCARLIPTDDLGPGAAEARAALYIQRSLAGWLASSRDAYVDGLAAVDAAAARHGGKRFADLDTAAQDAVLTSIDDTPFFALVRMHTIQGTFCDPAYGGNFDFVGWDLIGYPGIRLNATAADQRMGAVLKPMRRSAYDYAMFANTIGAEHAH